MAEVIRPAPNAAPRKAVFLDRDGVIIDNSRHYYIWKEEDMVIIPGVPEMLKALKQKGFLLIVISNQGGISHGQYTRGDAEQLHRLLNRQLGQQGASIDEFYFCPHHPDHEACLCRKPLPLMLEKAIARFGIDPAASWFVGDSERDLEAGRAAGVQTLLVEANRGMEGVMEEII
jgi:D-glycero-D-manno-heptose 1,7-bisphosphate phosphatase